mgnify:CR=1 FL=1
MEVHQTGITTLREQPTITFGKTFVSYHLFISVFRYSFGVKTWSGIPILHQLTVGSGRFMLNAGHPISSQMKYYKFIYTLYFFRVVCVLVYL